VLEGKKDRKEKVSGIAASHPECLSLLFLWLSVRLAAILRI
jgi:hypothetical protein